MASTGVTSADFGRTNSSKKYLRTQQREETEDQEDEEITGPSKASTDFLAQMRASLKAELAPLKSKAAPKPVARSSTPPQPAATSAPPPKAKKKLPPSASLPPPQKTFLSKAERRALNKKRKREQGQDR